MAIVLALVIQQLVEVASTDESSRLTCVTHRRRLDERTVDDMQPLFVGLEWKSQVFDVPRPRPTLRPRTPWNRIDISSRMSTRQLAPQKIWPHSDKRTESDLLAVKMALKNRDLAANLDTKPRAFPLSQQVLPRFGGKLLSASLPG